MSEMSNEPPVIDVLVVSQSCLARVNRAPYRVLAEMGWRVEIVAPAQYTTAGFTKAADAPSAGDPPLHLLEITSDHPRWFRFRGLPELLRARRPRIAMLDVDPGSRLAIEVGAMQRLHGGRTVCISCDNMPRTLRGELKFGAGAAMRLMVARTMSHLARPCVDHVFALSSDIARVMDMTGYGDRVSIMPLGFDPVIFRPDPVARERVRAALGLSQFTFAYFGRVEPRKGVHVFLEALHELRGEPWQLLIDEFKEYTHPYVQQIRDQIDRLGLADRVVYFDAPHETMGEYMNAADVVVLPSVSNPRWNEQYGRVAPEAMACGRVVVVSRCGALPELVGDAGVVIPENDVAALAATLRRAMRDDALRQELGARAAARAQERLSVPVQARRVHEVFSRWMPVPSNTAPG